MTQNVLYLEEKGYYPLPNPHLLSIAASDAVITHVKTEKDALDKIAKLPNLEVFLTNAPSHAVFAKLRSSFPKAKSILLTDLPMKDYSDKLHSEEELLLDHVIANRELSEWTLNELKITVRKLLAKDIFGIEKYLANEAKIFTETVVGSVDREVHNSNVMKYAETCKLGSLVSKTVFGITEELLMNAVYDAPVASGKEEYFNLPRTTRITLKPDEYATLRYGCDGQIFAISMADPFGMLEQQKLYQYVKKVLARRDSTDIIDTKKGGAGLGLFKVLYSCHSLIANVEWKKRTELIALLDIDSQLRDFSKMPRTIQYFSA